MKHLFSRLSGLILGFSVMLFLGCASTPPTRFFVLSPISDIKMMSKGEGEPCFAIGLGPVKIPEYLNQPGIVTRITPNEVRVDKFAKWAEPLEDNISRVLAENLPSLLCIRTIAFFPWKGSIELDYRIDVRVIQMGGTLGENAFLDVFWSIADGIDRKKSPLLIKRSSYVESTDGGDHESFISAQSRNLASFSREIAVSILGLPR
ncbi:MAG: membrane integrity-associated transporter subunit PqiC [Deltaproteobacteria bacterium]|nr:membrane integrity-associated transporter subunit PqiC [Deltaproteobacteria bacterium]